MTFFSFDGVDGTGKTTQIERFCDWLSQRGRRVVACRDPGSTPLGERLRSIVLQPSDMPIHRRSEMLLYMAARAQLVEEVIRPALASGATVVCDRFLLANVVYQGHAGGLDVETLWHIGSVATGGLLPDLVFLLDLDVATAVQRRGRDPDRMEAQGLEYLERVRCGFLEEAQRRGEIALIDARGDVESVQAEIRRVAAQLL